MKVFTYNDYIKSIHQLRLNAALQFAEEGATYGENKRKNIKTLCKILEEKDEFSQFINDFLYPKQKIESEQFLNCSNKNYFKRYKFKNPDLVYKIKNKDIFFIVEQVQFIEKSFPIRLVNYCIDIIYEWSKKVDKLETKTKYPLIVPIVIYIGKEKWSLPLNYEIKGSNENTYNNYKTIIKYNLIDINNISEEKLIKEHSLFGNEALLIKNAS